METRFSASFSDVRVHTDARAAEVASRADARAVTIGGDIYFAPNQFAPDTFEGRARLAHELVHVEQQRLGRRGGSFASARQAEREARELGGAAAMGRHVGVRAASPRAMQRDGPDAADSDPAPTPPSAPQQPYFNPEIEQLRLRHFMRWWLGTTILSGGAPSALPTVTVPGATAGPGAPWLPGVSDLPPGPIAAQFPLPSLAFSPLPPDLLFIEPDVGALFTPFATRGAPVGEGDSAVVFDIYRRNEALARGLPDLRAMAPGLLRPLIPGTWRRDIAGALTGAAVNAALKHDFPTPVEVSDRAWENMTGVSTTIIPLPAVSF
jgi:hypothetical protein